MRSVWQTETDLGAPNLMYVQWPFSWL